MLGIHRRCRCFVQFMIGSEGPKRSSALGDAMQMVDLTNRVQARYVKREDGTWLLDAADTT